MENALKTKYIKSNMTKEQLVQNGFHYNRIFSNNDTDLYTYRFPGYKYERFTILECELKIILGEDNVYINVFDYNTINRYASFYYM